MEKSYRDALTVALANSGGADASTISSWANVLRCADDALDMVIAAAVRNGEPEEAQKLADQCAELQACATFLDKLYEEMEADR